MQQMVNVWGPGFMHHDNLGLCESGEITEHYAPFSLCDLIMISTMKAMSVTQVRNLTIFIYAPFPLPLTFSLFSYAFSSSFPSPAIALGQTSIVSCLNCCVGLFIFLPTFTLFPHGFILCVWSDGTLTDRNYIKCFYQNLHWPFFPQREAPQI